MTAPVERIWVLRDPSGVVIACGPEERGPYYVLPAVEYDTRHADAMKGMRRCIDMRDFMRLAHAGYVLALEAHPRPSEVQS